MFIITFNRYITITKRSQFAVFFYFWRQVWIIFPRSSFFQTSLRKIKKPCRWNGRFHSCPIQRRARNEKWKRRSSFWFRFLSVCHTRYFLLCTFFLGYRMSCSLSKISLKTKNPFWLGTSDDSVNGSTVGYIRASDKLFRSFLMKI